MSYDSNLLRRAAARLEENRLRREQEQEALRQRLYAREPRLAQLDRQLRGTMSELLSTAIRQGSGTPVASIRDRNLALQRERAEVLRRMGLPPDALDGKPACPACGDTGWTGGQMCACLKKLYAQEQIQELSKLLDLGEQSFANFRWDYYSDTPAAGWEVSPRDNMKMIFQCCQRFADTFGRGGVYKNLFLTGAPGLGKTFLSACIARAVSEKGFSVVYDTAGSIFTQFEARKFSRAGEDPQNALDETRRYLNCDLLILDDLGSEMTTQMVRSSLYELINTRLVREKQTVISSNLRVEELEARYTPQIASRLSGDFTVLRFFGDDIRQKKKPDAPL